MKHYVRTGLKLLPFLLLMGCKSNDGNNSTHLYTNVVELTVPGGNYFLLRDVQDSTERVYRVSKSEMQQSPWISKLNSGDFVNIETYPNTYTSNINFRSQTIDVTPGWGHGRLKQTQPVDPHTIEQQQIFEETKAMICGLNNGNDTITVKR